MREARNNNFFMNFSYSRVRQTWPMAKLQWNSFDGFECGSALKTGRQVDGSLKKYFTTNWKRHPTGTSVDCQQIF
jgi:hypothetical protein